MGWTSLQLPHFGHHLLSVQEGGLGQLHAKKRGATALYNSRILQRFGQMIITKPSWGGQALVALCKSPSSTCFYWRKESGRRDITRCSFMKKVHDSSPARGTVRPAAWRVWTSVCDCRSRTGFALRTRHNAHFDEAGGALLLFSLFQQTPLKYISFFAVQVSDKVWDYPPPIFFNRSAFIPACMN